MKSETKRKRGRPRGAPTASISARVSVKEKLALTKLARSERVDMQRLIIEALHWMYPIAFD